MRFKAKALRSVLFVPGSKEDWMRKAHQYGPDALILDLEDSVPEEGKAEARILRAFSFSCLVGKAHHVESFAEMGIVAA